MDILKPFLKKNPKTLFLINNKKKLSGEDALKLEEPIFEIKVIEND